MRIQMFEFLSQSVKFVLGTFLILNSSLWSLMRFPAFLGLRYADNAIMWSFTVFWRSCSLFFFCPSLFCFLNLALFMTPPRTGTVWYANNKWQLSCRWGQAVNIAGLRGKFRITVTCPYPTCDILQRDHDLWRRVCNGFLSPPRPPTGRHSTASYSVWQFWISAKAWPLDRSAALLLSLMKQLDDESPYNARTKGFKLQQNQPEQ